MAQNFDSEHEHEPDLDLPLPGFRFHPTDEELVGFYLRRKIQKRPVSIDLIKQIDIYKYDPWDLPKVAASGEKEWYFYCQRDRKYRNSTRPNRVTGSGFWKATGIDKPIYSSNGMQCIGLKKSLVYYRGRSAKALKTDWMMHEFRLPSYSDFVHQQPCPSNDSWAICRIFKRTNTVRHGVAFASTSTSGHLHQTQPQNFNDAWSLENPRTSSYCVCGFSGRLASAPVDQIRDSGRGSQISNGIPESVEMEGRTIGFPVGSFDLTEFLVEMSDHDAGDSSFNQFPA